MWGVIIYSGIILFLFYLNHLYSIDVVISITRQLQLIFRSLFYTIVGLALLSFFTKSLFIIESRLVVFYFLMLSLIFLVTWRIIIFRTLLIKNYFSLVPMRKVLIVGAEGRGTELAQQIRYKNSLGLKIIGMLDDNLPIGTPIVNGYKVVGEVNELEKIVKEKNVNEVIFCLENIPDGEYLNLIERATRLNARILLSSKQFNVVTKYFIEERYGTIPVIGILNSPPYMGLTVFKRLLDIILSMIGLITLSPLFIAAGIAIKLESRGPVLYKQRRLGKDGIPFTFYKFRSMKSGSDQCHEREEKLKHFIQDEKSDNPATTKIVDEDKVTRVGRFIRKTSIDELPQLINVLMGDMSLVGPRPCLCYEWENYSEWHKKRLSVTPGCTGVWQVTARSAVGFRDMAILDMYYIYNISFHLDLWVILKTFPVMLFGTGGK